MTLESLIGFLEKYPRDRAVPMGFGHPHSYRGYYQDLAFEPVASTTVGEMLDSAKAALGTIYEGYKGGDYKMHGHTDCWLAHYGCCGEGIGPVLLSYMVGEVPEATERAEG